MYKEERLRSRPAVFFLLYFFDVAFRSAGEIGRKESEEESLASAYPIDIRFAFAFVAGFCTG